MQGAKRAVHSQYNLKCRWAEGKETVLVKCCHTITVFVN